MQPVSCFKRLLQFAPALLIGAGIAGCEKKQQAGAPPPPDVVVSIPVQREVIDWDDFTGHLDAPQSVVLSARVSGLIESMPFVEGSMVKKGQILVVIDDRPFKADLDAQLGNEARAKAAVDIAKSNFDREDLALKGNAVSQQDYDTAKATLDQAKAQLEAAKAAEESSRLNVEFCKVISPIDGRVGNKLVTVGNLINGGSGTVTQLTTIESIDPIYSYVDVDENSYLKYQKLAEQKKHEMAMGRGVNVPCFLELANETKFPRIGYIDFIDNHVDPATGTLKARGVFANKDGSMTPGMFSTMRLPGSGRYQTLLVPDKAVGADQDRRVLMVVNDKKQIEARPVTLGGLFGSLRSITSGIGPDDKVVTDGLMRIRPGMEVNPQEKPFEVNAADFAAGTGATTQEVPPKSDLNVTAATSPTTPESSAVSPTITAATEPAADQPAIQPSATTSPATTQPASNEPATSESAK